MPLRLNLLAEAQAEEELRRRDPVKRAIWIGGLLVCCVLLWYATLFIRTMTRKGELARFEARSETRHAQYQQITDNEKKLAETRRYLEALHRIARERFLWGNALNAMQQSAVDDVQLVRFRSEQTYALTEETKTKPIKPAFMTERITLFFDAKDNSATPGDRLNKYKKALEAASFVGGTTTTNKPAATITLKNLSAPTFDAESSKNVVMFSLECRLPDKVIP